MVVKVGWGWESAKVAVLRVLWGEVLLESRGHLRVEYFRVVSVLLLLICIKKIELLCIPLFFLIFDIPLIFLSEPPGIRFLYQPICEFFLLLKHFLNFQLTPYKVCLLYTINLNKPRPLLH